MEVNQTRPVERTNDARSHKTHVDRQQFSATKTEQQTQETTRSDANTRLSREVDRAEISEEAQRLAKREQAESEEN
ncbi:MAG: hypothetical protein ACI8TQ_000316 [Planctomycetota bacterium]|jgi:hypothetical protein